MLNGISNSVERYMDLLAARQKLVAGNIANADTPGYKTNDIDFQTEFRRQLDEIDEPAIVQPELETRNDGNNVSLDREARLLAENQIRFNIATQILRTEIRQIRQAINEGRSQ